MTQAAVHELNHEDLLVSSAKAALGQRIKEAREKLDITQEEMSSRIGKGRSAVAQWELGRSTPTLPDIEKLSKCLKVTPGWIAFGQKDASRHNVQVPLGSFDTLTDFNRKGVIEIPRAFLQSMGRPKKASLVAVTLTHDDELPGYSKGNVVVLDTDDKNLVTSTHHGIFDDYFAFAEASAVAGSPRDIRLKIGDQSIQCPQDLVPVVGRVIAVLVGFRV